MNSDYLSNKQYCCGCSACTSICPAGAIHKVADEKGFSYPRIDTAKCINCGLCIKVCDFKKEREYGGGPLNVYAVKNANLRQVESSRSGAFFIAIAEHVLQKGGIVFGCELNEKMEVIHSFCEDEKSLKKFKGSKYVESDIGDCFKACRDFLKKGKPVLFSGTGCQMHGLISFLKVSNTPTDGLITCDVICHGVPSPLVWKIYIDLLRRKKKIKYVNFRDKQRFGWRDTFESYELTTGKKIYSENWAIVFYKNILFRESCFSCRYASFDRSTDFTIGDCWGVEKVAPELDDNKGVSLVLVNTQKAAKVFSDISDGLLFKEIDLELVMQRNLRRPTPKGREYDAFWGSFAKNDVETVKKYFFDNHIEKLKARFSMIVKKVFH